MKKMKRFMSLMLTLVLAMAMGVTAFAQNVGPKADAATGTAEIKINNPAKGETYTIYKLFDATVAEDGNIAYKADEIPNGLDKYFKVEGGYVIPKAKEETSDSILKDDGTTEMTDALKADLENWAKTATAFNSAVSEGEDNLVFTGLPYGYYVITTTHKSDPELDEDGKPIVGEDGNPVVKSAITVTSINPQESVYDKNVNEPSAKKEADEESYSIGDTVTYTGTFDTTNYMGDGENSKQVVEYLITDTLPEYLEDPEVISITIGEKSLDVADLQFNSVRDKGDPADSDESPKMVQGIIIPWAEQNGDSYTNLYAQGAKIVIKYTAVLTSTTNVGIADTNTISIRPYYVDDETNEKEPWEESWKDKAEIYTYAAGIQKVDEAENALKGAEFTIKGLVVTPVEGEDGVYTVVSYDPNSDQESDALTTDENGRLYIIGLAENVDLTVTEFKAPDGYNKLTDPETLKVTKFTEEVIVTGGTRYYDEDGNLTREEVYSENTVENAEKNLDIVNMNVIKIENQKGTLLPSTGGIGTTIFYVVGGILVVAAGILLVTKKRMSAR